MNEVIAKPSYLDDPKLDLKVLGFTKEEIEESPSLRHMYYTLQLTDDMSIVIGTSFKYGERISTTTELVIGGMGEVLDVQNKYDIYIQIATLRPSRMGSEVDVIEVLSKFGKLQRIDRTDTALKIWYYEYPREIGVLTKWIMLIRQLFPEYNIVKNLESGFGRSFHIHLSI